MISACHLATKKSELLRDRCLPGSAACYALERQNVSSLPFLRENAPASRANGAPSIARLLIFPIKLACVNPHWRRAPAPAKALHGNRPSSNLGSEQYCWLKANPYNRAARPHDSTRPSRQKKQPEPNHPSSASWSLYTPGPPKTLFHTMMSGAKPHKTRPAPHPANSAASWGRTYKQREAYLAVCFVLLLHVLGNRAGTFIAPLRPPRLQ